MPCPYYNKEKDNIADGIYCNRMGGRPGVRYWQCYCDHNYRDCPIYDPNAEDPFELDPRTTERKKRAEDSKKANEVIRWIDSIPYHVSTEDSRTIENARYAYNQLTRDQKEYVSNYHKLTEAERALSNARTEKENEEAERRAREYRQKGQNAKSEKRTDTAQPSYSYGSDGTCGIDEYGEWYIDSKTGLKLYRAKKKHASGFWNKVNPHWNQPPVIVILSRIALAIASVLAWYCGLPYQTPRAVEWLYLILGCGQLLSLIFSYVLTDAKQLRLITWGVCGLSFIVMLLLLYLNYNFKMVLFLVLISFLVPIVWFGCKGLVKIAGFIAEHFF